MRSQRDRWKFRIVGKLGVFYIWRRKVGFLIWCSKGGGGEGISRIRLKQFMMRVCIYLAMKQLTLIAWGHAARVDVDIDEVDRAKIMHK